MGFSRLSLVRGLVAGGDCEQLVRFYDCEGRGDRAIIVPESQYYYREKMTCRDAFTWGGFGKYWLLTK